MKASGAVAGWHETSSLANGNRFGTTYINTGE